MAVTITLQADKTSLTAALNDTPAARQLAGMLPIEVRMSRWGDEYYGSIGATLPSSGDERDEMKIGEIAYWPPGRALCLFFGPTPASEGDEPRAASPVIPLGLIEGDAKLLAKLPGSVLVKVSAA